MEIGESRCTQMNKNKTIKTFDRQANLYEKRRKNQKDRFWRKKLLSSANGKVLEVAVGAGANFQYYPRGVEVTAIDISEEMLKKAKEAAIEEGVDAQFIHTDVESLSCDPHSFDTVLSTLSLCSYEHPTTLLNSFNHWCKPDGQILLMEHGKSSNSLIGSIQTILNPLHKKLAGCELNRNMLHIIESSDIKVERIEHYLAGMLHLIWAKPNKKM